MVRKILVLWTVESLPCFQWRVENNDFASERLVELKISDLIYLSS